MNARFSLERLIAPVSKETFFADSWEQKPLLIRHEDAHWFDGLVTVEDIHQVITSRRVFHPEIGITNAARKVETHEYTWPSGMIDVARLYQQFADGGTIVLQNLEAELEPLAALCRSMECELSTRFQTNLYYTPEKAQGFKPHYDSHDVFVLQVHGTKHWLLYDTPVVLPYRRQEFHPDEHPVGNVTMEFDLHQGDLLYIPRGVMHDARTVTGDSLHVTLGVLFTSWTDLLVESLALAGLRDPAFRRSLPIGFARPEHDREGARREFHALLRRLVERAEFDPAYDHFIDDLVSSRHPILPGQFEGLRALPSLTVESRVGVRPDLLYRVRETDETLTLMVYGALIRLPRHAASALRYAIEHEDFTVKSLPGDLDDAGKLVLVRRLVREGVLAVLAA